MSRSLTASRAVVVVTAAGAALAFLGTQVAAGTSEPAARPTPIATREVLVTQLGGPVVCTAHLGHVAFVAVGSRVHSLDVSDPDHPVYLGGSDILDGEINDIVAADDLLFVAHDRGLAVLNARDPARLPQTDEYPMNGGAGDVAWNDYYAYLSATGQAFELDRVIDVAIPTDLRYVNYFGESGPKDDVAVVGRKLYAVENMFVSTFDLADTALPVEQSRLFVDDYAVSVAADDRHVFIGRPKDVMVLDAGEPQAYPTPTYVLPPTPTPQPTAPAPHRPAAVRPTAPAPHRPAVARPAAPAQPLAIVPTDGQVEHILLRGDLAYVAAGASGGLRILDVSDATSPKTLSVSPAGEAQYVDLIGDHAYVAGGGDGLFVFDVRDPASPRQLAVDPLVAWSRTMDVAWHGDRAMVAAGASGLVALDVSDPRRPRLLGRVAVPGGVERLAWVHDVVYTVAGGEVGPGWLNIVAVTDPARPWVISTVRTPGSAEGVFATDDRVFVADGSRGIRIWGVSQLDAPTYHGDVGDSIWMAADVLVAGDEAYVVDRGLGLRVVDVSAGGYLGEIGRLAFFTQWGVQGIAFADQTLFVAGSSSPLGDGLGFSRAPQGYLRIDVTDPRRPAVAEEVSLPALPQSIALGADDIYVASLSDPDNSTLAAASMVVANRADPSQRWAVHVPDGLQAVAVQGDHALLAADRGGIVVADLADNVFPTVTPADMLTPEPAITRPPSQRTATPTRVSQPTVTVPPLWTPTPTPTITESRLGVLYLPSLQRGGGMTSP
jgi:hypothetical protein